MMWGYKLVKAETLDSLSNQVIDLTGDVNALKEELKDEKAKPRKRVKQLQADLEASKRESRRLEHELWFAENQVEYLSPGNFFQFLPLKDNPEDERNRQGAAARELLNSDPFKTLMSEVSYRVEQGTLAASSEEERIDAVRMKQLFQSIKREIYRISRYGQN